MAVVTLDSSNLQAVLDDAQGIVTEPKVDLREAGDKPTPTEDVTDVEEKPKAKEQDDDVEDENGLTAAQKAELSAKMLKAIGKKHRQVKEAEEFAAAQYAERKLAEERATRIQRELEELKSKSQPQEAKPEAPKKPARYDFQDEEAYMEALTDWKVDEKLRQKAEQDAKQAEERRQQEIVQTARGRIEKAMELVPDFQEVTAVDLDVPPAVAAYMQESELLAELGYHFAKNPDDLVSLRRLTPAKQLVKLGAIEAKLTPFGEKPKNVQATSTAKNAPAASDETGAIPSKARVAAPVIRPLSSAGTGSQEPDVSEMSYAEAKAAWQKANKANFHIRKRH